MIGRRTRRPLRTHVRVDILAGIPVPDRDELEVTRRFRASGFVHTAETLELAYDMERRVVALTA